MTELVPRLRGIAVAHQGGESPHATAQDDRACYQFEEDNDRVEDSAEFERHGETSLLFFGALQLINELSVLHSAQRQRRQLTAPGLDPAVTSGFHPLKAPKVSSLSRLGTLKWSRAWPSSA